MVRRVGSDTAISAALTQCGGGLGRCTIWARPCWTWPWRSHWAGSLFGPVAYAPTVSRLIGTLATSGEKASRAARAEVL